MTMLVNIEDARLAARRRLPKIFFDYIDGGAFSEATMRANQADFGRWRLEQRVLVDSTAPDLSTTFCGARQPLPFMLGPVGFLGLFAGRGEVLAARAAHAAGIPLCLSSFSITSITALRQATPGPLHFQLYILKDRAICEDMLKAAEAAGVDTLHLTADTSSPSIRERDVRNGFRAVKRLTLPLIASMALRPAWCLDQLRAGSPVVGAVAHRPEFGHGALEQAANLSRAIDPAMAWSDITWLRQRWKGRLTIKGVLSAEDAVRARDCGADGVVVSNHGGRQLDAASSTIAVLPEVVAAVGGDIEVMIDGGFRRGTDIVKALALGASGVMLGRAYAYGVGAAGEAGVARVIAMLRDELAATLALMGIASIDEIKRRGTAVLRRVS